MKLYLAAFCVAVCALQAQAESHLNEEPNAALTQEAAAQVPIAQAKPEPAVIDSPNGVFATYPELRVTLDKLMMSRDIDTLMITFGGGDDMTATELQDLEARVKSIYPQDFQRVEVIRREIHKNGWRQELLAYSNGVNFVYAYLLLNERTEDIVSVNFRFNSQFHALNKLF